MRYALIVMLFIYWQGTVVPGDVHAATGKPQPPVTVSISPENADLSQERTLSVMIHSNVNVPELSAVIEAKDGAEMLAGDTSWQGSLKRGVKHALQIIVRQSPTGRGSVRVIVTIPGDKGPVYTARVEYPLSGKSFQKKKAPVKQEVIRKDKRGNKIVEHPLQ